MTYDEVIRRLYAMRSERGLTQADVASGLSVKRSSVSLIERGKQRIKLDQFLAMLDMLGVTPREFFDQDIHPADLTVRLRPGQTVVIESEPDHA